MKKLLLLLLLPAQLIAQPFSTSEIGRWEKQAKQVTIIRDNYGIPHIYGKTDADAVFGLLYAQCEDDFKRVEMNYIEKLGRMSEIKGESSLQDDLYIKLIIDSAEAVADYKKSPIWLQKLLNAYADGINYYLYKHPEVKPALLTRFKPWYQLLWTDGSIGAISTGDITENDVKKFYLGDTAPAVAKTKDYFEEQVTGSNGFAIAPSKTASGNAILYINPHVTFYFRPEVHVVSDEGLNAYGAVTWGQFFVYQGFNQYCGWMHTSGNMDVADMYNEKIVKKNNKLFYEYNKALKPVTQKIITLRYKKDDVLHTKAITTYYTHHGPIMANRNGQWISVRGYNRSLTSLMQSFLRTKTKGLEDYKKNMAMLANTSNNTVFADNKGNIAYWHGNYMPRRDKKLNWSNAVDGTTSATEWKGLHPLNETVHVYNPATGWIQNCNSTPFTVSGSSSPKKENYPAYMAPDGENFRGVNAARVLDKENKFTIEKIIAAGYDQKLSAMEVLIPALVSSFEKNISAADSLYQTLAAPIQVLKDWNYYSSENSVATTLAIEWAQKLTTSIQRVYIDEGWDDQVTLVKKFAATASPQELLPPLAAVVKELKNKFGKWQMPWGDVNRYQRISNDIIQKYKDDEPSYPVGFASASWGQLPSYNSRYYAGTKKRYGVSGNSFICAVEFGKKIKAKSLLAGGNSGDPSSKHFTDQLEMYTKGIFKDVLFYKEDVLKHSTRSYHPGE
ncbi:MAG: penicillin acylase family protein [Chitinophagaceae bacterium]|nr:penicillin acylase family protein [Chitinophagaceae bacterium]MBP7109874.1 penicillin acylase family protein [Chitinophagaceae bacterium]MBP7316403.1 penicillin acylase family protein [Chitinophagaceae bacterium]